MKDAKIYKPLVNDRGISDPVTVFTSNNMVLVAWWDERDKFWHSLDGDSFGNVLWFDEIEFPKGWTYDDVLYGGEE